MYQRLLRASRAGIMISIAALTVSFAASAEQEVYLGREGDACSGSLSVKNRWGQYVPITRGVRTPVDVAINGDGYWYWKCGNSEERSRGDADYRQRIKRVKVLHSTGSRSIDWKCFDLL